MMRRRRPYDRHALFINQATGDVTALPAGTRARGLYRLFPENEIERSRILRSGRALFDISESSISTTRGARSRDVSEYSFTLSPKASIVNRLRINATGTYRRGLARKTLQYILQILARFYQHAKAPGASDSLRESLRELSITMTGLNANGRMIFHRAGARIPFMNDIATLDYHTMFEQLRVAFYTAGAIAGSAGQQVAPDDFSLIVHTVWDFKNVPRRTKRRLTNFLKRNKYQVFGSLNKFVETVIGTLANTSEPYPSGLWKHLRMMWKQLDLSPVFREHKSNCFAGAYLLACNKKYSNQRSFISAASRKMRDLVDFVKGADPKRIKTEKAKPLTKKDMPELFDLCEAACKIDKVAIKLYKVNMEPWKTFTPEGCDPKTTAHIWIVGEHAVGLIQGFKPMPEGPSGNRRIISYNTLMDKGKDMVLSILKHKAQKAKMPEVYVYDFESYALPKDEEFGKQKIVIPYAGGIIGPDDKPLITFERDCTKSFTDMLLERVCEPVLKKAKYSGEKQRITLLAHNGGKFDIHFLIAELVKRDGVEPGSLIPRNGRTLLFTFFYRPRKNANLLVRVIDLYSFLSRDLRSLCKDFQTDVVKSELDYEKYVTWEDVKKDRDVIAKYLIADLRSTKELALKYDKIEFDQFGIHPLNYITISSYIRGLFKIKYYNDIKYPLYQLNADLEREIRQNYFKGGRSGCFRIGWFTTENGAQELHHLDVTSEYPFVMVKRKIPYGKPKLVLKGDEKIMLEGDYCGFFKIRVKNTKPRDETPICVFPVKMDGMLIYPYFAEATIIDACTPEIQFALENKEILGLEIDVLSGYTFAQGYYWKEMVETFFKKKQDARKKGEEAKATAAKIGLNSIYGSTGLGVEGSSFIWSKQTDYAAKDMLQLGLLKNITKIGRFILLEKVTYMANTMSYVPAAAIITSHARTYLTGLMLDVLKSGGVVLAFDTDSILYQIPSKIGVPESHRKLLSMSNELGGLKPEETDIEEVVVAGAKMYAVKTRSGEEVIKCKGWSQKTDGVKNKWRKKIETKNTIEFMDPHFSGDYYLTYEDYRTMVTKSKEIKQEVLRFSGTANNLFNIDKWGGSLRMSRDTVSFKPVYNKGDWDKKTGIIRPFIYKKN